MESVMTKMLKDASKNKERIRANVAWLNTPAIGKIVDTVDYLIEKHQLKVYSDTGYYASSVYLTADNLEGLKDESLAALLDSLVCSNPTSTRTTDNPGSYSRTYSFEWVGDYDNEYNRPAFCVAVTATFKKDSDTCKRVIVGYREPSTEPTPIYELQCEDEGTPPDYEPNHEPHAYPPVLDEIQALQGDQE